MTQTEQNSERKFLIIQGDDTATVVGRMNAVEQAKAMSREKRRGVEVRSQDGAVRIRYRDGQMENYVYETPGRRGRARSDSN